MRRVTKLLLACLVLVPAALIRAETMRLDLVLSDSSLPYRQFADSFHNALTAGLGDVKVKETSEILRGEADYYVAVGMKAAELALSQADKPIIVAMVPEASYREMLEHSSRQETWRVASVIFINQPWNRLLAFVRAAMPGRNRMGLLYATDLHIGLDHLRTEIAVYGGKLVAHQVDAQNHLFADLESVLDDSDYLLAIPDSSLYSSSNIRNILLTSYRHRVPVVGISKSYVKAGAVCAIFSTPEQLGRQAARTVLSVLRGQHLHAEQYSSEYSIEYNEQVARSLGIELPPLEQVYEKLGGNGRSEP